MIVIIMNITQKLELIGLKNRVIIALQFYIRNAQHLGLISIHCILDLLKQKYCEINDDLNFIEVLKNNLQNNMPIILSSINNYNNGGLLSDLLKGIDTGVSFDRIEYLLNKNAEVTNKLVIENTIITSENGDTVNCMKEDMKDILQPRLV